MAFNGYGHYDPTYGPNYGPYHGNPRIPKANYMDTLDPATQMADPRKTTRFAHYFPWASNSRSLRWCSIIAVALIIFLLIGSVLGLVLGLIPFYTTRSLTLSFTTTTVATPTITSETPLNTTATTTGNSTSGTRLNATQVASPDASLFLGEKQKPLIISAATKQPPTPNLEKKSDDELDFEPVDLATRAPETPFVGSLVEDNQEIAKKLKEEKIAKVRKELGIQDEENW